MKQVQFTDDCDKVKEPEIMHTSNNALDSSALGLSCGNLFGQTSPVKPDICREKSCKKKATFTLESEVDDSIRILCALIMPREFLAQIKLKVSSNVFVVFPISLPVLFIYLFFYY